MKTTTNRWTMRIKRLAGESHYKGHKLAWYEHRNSKVDAADLCTWKSMEMRWALDAGPSAEHAQAPLDLAFRHAA